MHVFTSFSGGIILRMVVLIIRIVCIVIAIFRIGILNLVSLNVLGGSWGARKKVSLLNAKPETPSFKPLTLPTITLPTIYYVHMTLHSKYPGVLVIREVQEGLDGPKVWCASPRTHQAGKDQSEERDEGRG